jgi:hypothetical protein
MVESNEHYSELRLARTSIPIRGQVFPAPTERLVSNHANASSASLLIACLGDIYFTIKHTNLTLFRIKFT